MSFRLTSELRRVEDARAELKTADLSQAQAVTATPRRWRTVPGQHVELLAEALTNDPKVEIDGQIEVFVRELTADTPDASQDASIKAKELIEAKEALNAKWGRNAFMASTIVLIALGAVGWLAGHYHWLSTTDNAGAAQFRALEWASPITSSLLILAGLMFIGFDQGGVVRFLVGKDNRYSTSAFQVALWTIAIVFAFIMFIVQMAHDAKFTNDEAFGSFNSDYLFLLGGPFAAALLSKFTTVTKTNDQTVQQTAAAVPTSKDLVTDQSGATSLTDAQFFLFNVVALGYFAVGFAQNAAALPDINQTLIGLTSASALTYVGGKVVNSNPPVVSSVSIMSGALDGRLTSGTKLRILGKNFQPADTDKESDVAPAVLFGNTEVITLDLMMDTEVRVTVPTGLPVAPADISVRTSHGVSSEPWKGLEVGA